MYKGKRFSAIILAGGSGKRMSSKRPKQYMDIHNKPLLYYSIQAFQESDVDEIIIVSDPAHHDYCAYYIVKKYRFSKVKRVVDGGDERFQSSANGLNVVGDSDYVLIHDGARPCLSQETIRHCMDTVMEHGACTAAVPMIDTVCQVDETNRIGHIPNRNLLWSIQTPQCFRRDEIIQAHRMLAEALPQMDETEQKLITDDVRVYKSMLGLDVYTCLGSYENIKVTTLSDVNKVKTYIAAHTKVL